MRTLAIDIETYCNVDLRSCGVYQYASGEDFEILLFAYAYDDDPVTVIDLAQGQIIPPHVLADLADWDVRKTAYNATFERVCLSRYLGETLDPGQWQDTMVLAAMAGLPLGLDAVAKAMKLENQKDTVGKSLIRYFSMPCKPTRSNGNRTRNLPHHDPARWELFKKYNAKDVIVERDIRNEVIKYQNFTEFENKLYEVDQCINDRGFKLDRKLIEEIVNFNQIHQEQALEAAKGLTGLDNPQSLQQLKEWLAQQGLNQDTLRKAYVEQLLLSDALPQDVRQVLELRQELGKTSLKKYDAMLKVISDTDDRARGTMQFYGASRTGRWAGRLIQVQNLPRNYAPEIPQVRELIKAGHIDALPLIYDDPADILSQLIRTAIVPEEDHTFVVSDYSAIEARVIAWLAREEWLQEIFAGAGKVYEATASRMFNVPIDQVDKALRQRGKVATLALGYQGGVNALAAMGALKMGIPEHELPQLVKAWRKSNPNIVALWDNVESLALHAINHPDTPMALWPTKLCPDSPRVYFTFRDNHLFITLPSGRELCYYQAKLSYTAAGPKLTYQGASATTKTWGTQNTYGGKLVENIVQAIARDCIGMALVRLHQAGYKAVFHVHDEVVIEVPTDQLEPAFIEIQAIMSQPINWAPGLGLPASGFMTEFYTKD